MSSTRPDQSMQPPLLALVDLDGEPPAYTQKALHAPPVVSPLQSSEDVERLAEALLKALESEDGEAKVFLR